MLVERTVPSSWAGQRLEDLEEPTMVRAAAVSRLGAAQLPRPELVLQEGDVLYLAVAGDALADVDERLNGSAHAAGHH
jgi:trk system potassium uptake protein